MVSPTRKRASGDVALGGAQVEVQDFGAEEGGMDIDVPAGEVEVQAIEESLWSDPPDKRSEVRRPIIEVLLICPAD